MSGRFSFAQPGSLDEALTRQTALRIEVAELRERGDARLHRKEQELGRLNQWIKTRQAAAHAATDWSLLLRAVRYLEARQATGEDIGKDGERLARDIRNRLPDWYRKEHE